MKKIISKAISIFITAAITIQGVTALAAVENPKQTFNTTTGSVTDIFSLTSGSIQAGGSNMTTTENENLGKVISVTQGTNSWQREITAVNCYFTDTSAPYFSVSYRYTGDDSTLTGIFAQYSGEVGNKTVSITGDGQWHTVVFDYTDSTSGKNIEYVRIRTGAETAGITFETAQWHIYGKNPVISKINANIALKSGASPTTFTPATNDNFTVNSLTWKDSSGNTADTITAGETYTAEMSLTANEGYIFKADGFAAENAANVQVLSTDNDLYQNTIVVTAEYTAKSASKNAPLNFNTAAGKTAYYNMFDLDPSELQTSAGNKTMTTDAVLGNVLSVVPGSDSWLREITEFSVWFANTYAPYFSVTYRYTGDDSTMDGIFANYSAELNKKTMPIKGDGQWHTVVFDYTDITEIGNIQYARIRTGAETAGKTVEFAQGRIYAKNPVISSVAKNLMPIAGQTAPTENGISGNFEINSLKWKNIDGSDATSFEAGKKYIAELSLTADEDFTFKTGGFTVTGADSAEVKSVDKDLYENTAVIEAVYTAEPATTNAPLNFNTADGKEAYYNMFDLPVSQFETNAGNKTMTTDAVLGNVLSVVPGSDSWLREITEFNVWFENTYAPYFSVSYRYTGDDSTMDGIFANYSAELNKKTMPIKGDGQWHTVVFDYTDVTARGDIQYARIRTGAETAGKTVEFAQGRIYAKNPIITDTGLDIAPYGDDIASIPSISSDKCRLVSFAWKDASGNDVSVFEAGKQYTAVITMKAYTNYMFTDTLNVSGADSVTVTSLSNDLSGNTVTAEAVFTAKEADIPDLAPNGDMETEDNNFVAAYASQGHNVSYVTDGGSKALCFDATGSTASDWAVSWLWYKTELKAGHTYYYSFEGKADPVTGTGISFWFTPANKSCYVTNEYTKHSGTFIMTEDSDKIVWLAQNENTAKYYIDNFKLYDVTRAKEISYSSTGAALEVTAPNGIVDNVNDKVYAVKGTELTVKATPVTTYGKYTKLNNLTKTAENMYNYTVTDNGSFGIEYADSITYEIDGANVKVTAHDAGERSVIFASYDSNGKITGVHIADADTSAQDQTISVASGFESLDNVRIFCWDGVDTMMPLRRAASKKTDNPQIFVVGDTAAVTTGLSHNEGWGTYFGGLLDGATVINESKRDTSFNAFLQEQLYTDMQSKWKSGDYCILALGVGDAQNDNITVEAYQSGLNEVISKAKAAGVTVILLKETRTADVKDLAAYDLILETIDETAKTNSLDVIDLESATRNIPEVLLQTRGNALTKSGARFVAETIAELLHTTGSELQYYVK